jgi:site-specific DNA-methyltransferase (adenine-specific)
MSLPRNVVLVGDARQRLAELPAGSVDCVVTSPPYFNLRDYGTTGQIGLEDHVSGWVDELRLVMRAVARVLKPSGSVWLNVGDAFSRHDRYGAPPKSLLLGPERLALALLDDGWTVRNRVAWMKQNTMPCSVRDRLACTWEVVYLLTRNRRYYFDLDAIRIPHRSAGRAPYRSTPGGYPPKTAIPPTWGGALSGSHTGLDHLKARGLVGHPLGKNPGDAWSLPVSNFRGQHFATFPTALVTRPLLATCPERVCRACGEPWQREIRRDKLGILRPNCDCNGDWQPGLVLDPFFGAGTVGLVAEQQGRDWLGIELNTSFARLARERIVAARTKSPGPGKSPHSSSDCGTINITKAPRQAQKGDSL